MELWIPITIAAAFLQNLRSVGQKHLKGVMGTTGATFVRFGFGLPFAAFYVLLLNRIAGYAFPAMPPEFFGWVVVGGLGQITATFLLVHLFSFRNFAVGTAYSRTEPAQAALFGLVFLGETVTAGTLMAIAVSVFGVMLISVAHTALTARNLVATTFSRTALIGLASGTCFGVSAVAYRAASLSLGGPNFTMQAAVTLLVVITFQTLVMAAWMLARLEAVAVRRLRRRHGLVRLVHGDDPAAGGDRQGAGADRDDLHVRLVRLLLQGEDQPVRDGRLPADRRRHPAAVAR